MNMAIRSGLKRLPATTRLIVLSSALLYAAAALPACDQEAASAPDVLADDDTDNLFRDMAVQTECGDSVSDRKADGCRPADADAPTGDGAATDTVTPQDTACEVAQLHFREAVTQPGAFGPWQQQTLAFYRQAMGLEGATVPPPAVEVVSAQTSAPGLQRMEIRYTSFDGRQIPAFLFVPETEAPVPAVIVYHGHGLGKIQLVDGVGSKENALATYLAETLGYVVLAPDTRTFGEFLIEGYDHDTYTEAVAAGGSLFTTEAVLDGLSDLAVLDRLRAADPSLVGVAGLSGGCWRAINVAVQSQRPQATVCNGLYISWDHLFGIHHCACQHAPPLAERMDMADLGALLLPRAFMVQWGLDDYIYEQGGAELIDLTRAAYAVLGLDDRFLADLNPGISHQFENEDVARWLHAQLGDGAWSPPAE